MAHSMSPIIPQMIKAPRVELENSLLQLLNSLTPGDRLPPEPDLARQLGVSRAMLREVVTGLVERGMLIRRQGIGTFVASQTQFIDYGLEVLESLDSLAKRTGIETEVRDLTITNKLLDVETARRYFSRNEEMTVLEISREIGIKGKIVAFLIDIIPNNVLSKDEVQSSIHGSIYDLLVQKKDIQLSYSRTEIMALNADDDMAKKLEVHKGTSLIKLTAQLYTTGEQIVDYSYSYFVPGKFQFHVMRRLGRPVES
ncbi:MAG: GntR family transcriptional regulator [Chloroflexi bacterium]|nr:GntR family transcriptional regulator [Chloroflexota bacterium]